MSLGRSTDPLSDNPEDRDTSASRLSDNETSSEELGTTTQPPDPPLTDSDDDKTDYDLSISDYEDSIGASSEEEQPEEESTTTENSEILAKTEVFRLQELISLIGEFLSDQGLINAGDVCKQFRGLFAAPLETRAKKRIIESIANGDPIKETKIAISYPYFNVFQGTLLADAKKTLLLAIAKGEQKKVENLMRVYPRFAEDKEVRATKFLRVNALRQLDEIESLIKGNPDLLELKGLAIDPRTGLVFEGIYPLQYDIFMLDTTMCDMKLKYLPTNVAALQFKEHFSEAPPAYVKANGRFFDLSKIKQAYRRFNDAIETYLLVSDICSKDLISVTLQATVEKIGKTQLSLPIHMWFEFLREDLPFIRDNLLRDFSEELSQNPQFFADVNLMEGENTSCAVIRADLKAFMLVNPAGNENLVELAEKFNLDLKVIQQLEKSRITSIVELHKQYNPLKRLGYS